MLATTNSKTQEILEVLEALPIVRVSPLEAQHIEARSNQNAMRDEALAALALERIKVDESGDYNDYFALAKRYDALGAQSNASACRRRAIALRDGVR